MKMDPVDWAYWNSRRAVYTFTLTADVFTPILQPNEMRIALWILCPRTTAIQLRIDGTGLLDGGGIQSTNTGPVLLSRRDHGDIVRAGFEACGDDAGATITVVECLAPKQCVCWDASPDAYMG